MNKLAVGDIYRINTADLLLPASFAASKITHIRIIPNDGCFETDPENHMKYVLTLIDFTDINERPTVYTDQWVMRKEHLCSSVSHDSTCDLLRFMLL